MLRLYTRFLEPAHRRQVFAVPGVCQGIIRIFGKGALEFLYRLGRVPVIVKINETHAGVGFGKSIIHFEGSLGGFLGGREGLFRRQHRVKAESGIRIGNAYVGLRKCWVKSNRLAEIFQPLYHPLLGSLVPEITALNVGFVCVWPGSRSLGEAARLLAGEL